MDILFNNNRSFIEGVSVDEITKSFSTPLYIYSQKKIEKDGSFLSSFSLTIFLTAGDKI